MRQRLLSLATWLGAVLVVCAVIAVPVYLFTKHTLLPPEEISMAAGRKGGAYYNFALRYRTILSFDDIKVNVVETAGSEENARLLESGEVDVALLQGGIPVSEDADIEALAAIFLEPFFILHRGALPEAADPTLWQDLKVAAGEPGSGTRAAVLSSLDALGISVDDSRLFPLGGDAAAEALQSGDIDVAVFVAPITAPYLRDLLVDPVIQIDTIRDSEALARSLSYVRMVDIPPSGIDYAARLPEERVPLTAMVAALAAPSDLHPSVIDRLVRAAGIIHSGPNPLSADLQFPAPEGAEFPINEQAEEALTSGPNPLNKVLPYWMTAQIQSVMIFFVLLLLLSLPILRSFPSLYVWRMRQRVFRYYRDLLAVERTLHSTDVSLAEAQELTTQLDHIDAAISSLAVPLRYREYAYSLRLHVDLVRRHLTDKLESDGDGAPKSPLPPAPRPQGDPS